MILTHKPQTDFYFGGNIHLAYSLSLNHFVFIHSSLAWIISDLPADPITALISKIEPEDLLFFGETFKKVKSGSFSGNVNFKLRDTTGLRWLQVTPFLVELDGDDLIIATVMEVTNEVLSIQAITKFADKKNSTLHMLGHDLRGPLNVAKSVAKSLARQITDPAVLDKTQYIALILQKAIDLISDLVSREFSETTSIELVKQRVDVVERVRDYLEECKRSEPLAKIEFQMTSSADKIVVRLDDVKFMQIINNLISNSLKFTPEGGKIYVSISESQDEVHFEFSDNGVGIPENLLPQVFEKFTNARRPGLRGEPTVGLGLSIVKTIIGWHGGMISCESTEGIGTTFFINLPKGNSE